MGLLSVNGALRKQFIVYSRATGDVKRRKVTLAPGVQSWTTTIGNRECRFTLDSRLCVGNAYFFDADRGIQVGPPAVGDEWLAPDGFESFADNHDDRLRMVNASNRIKLEKYLKWILYGVIVAVGSPIACLMFLLQKL